MREGSLEVFKSSTRRLQEKEYARETNRGIDHDVCAAKGGRKRHAEQ